jgi:hypothetical protein
VRRHSLVPELKMANTLCQGRNGSYLVVKYCVNTRNHDVDVMMHVEGLKFGAGLVSVSPSSGSVSECMPQYAK